jgi:hypothetical protein
MSEALRLENKSNTDYILEYIANDKKNFMFLFSGDQRTIKNKAGETGIKISSSCHGLKDFSFFSSFPGKIIIQKSEKDEYDFIYDLNLSKKINLKFSKKELIYFKKELVNHAVNIINFNQSGKQKKTINIPGIVFFPFFNKDIKKNDVYKNLLKLNKN